MKRDTIIKILSLSLGLTIGIVLIAKIFYELSYDTAYPDSDRIYKIVSNSNEEDEVSEYDQVSGAIAPGMKAEVPGVEAATRTTRYGADILVDKVGNKYKMNGFAADTAFFDVFNQYILTGYPKEVLSDPSKVMISKKFADLLGGTEHAEGKILYDESFPDHEYTVSGVFENFKTYGSISPDIIYSLNVMDERSYNNWDGNDRYHGYVKLQENIDPNTLKDAIKQMQLKHQDMNFYAKKGIEVWFTLRSLQDMHLNYAKVKSAVIILSIIAILIITVSLMNYLLIGITGLVKKTKEIAVLKCYGAGRFNIFIMFLRKSLLEMLTALLLAAVLIFVGRNLINNITGYSISELFVPNSIIAVITVLIVILIISVIVPVSLYMKMPVVKAIKGYKENSKKWKTVLLGIEIAINIFIVIFILVIGLQYRKVNNFNPGYASDNILTIRHFSGGDEYLKIISELKKNPHVEDAGVSASLLYKGVSGNWVAPIDMTDESEAFNIADLMGATPEIFDIFKINFLDGSKPVKPQEIAVSKSFVDKMNGLRDWNDGAVGKQIQLSGHNESVYTITGVYDDILLGNLLNSDERPSLWPFSSYDDFYLKDVVIKVTEINPEIISEIKNDFSKITDKDDITVEIYKDNIIHGYDESMKIKTVLLIGGAFSLLIALMGLIGFLNDESQRRTKELAIRKINGASSKDLFRLFYSSIIKLSLASAIVACSGAFIMGRHWLEQFSEKIPLSPLIFICGTLLILIVVSVVVMINSYKVITANPTQSLYNE